MCSDDIFNAVVDYATEHYEEDGWDILVECFTGLEVRRAIGEASSLEEALSNVDKALGISLYASVRADVRGS